MSVHKENNGKWRVIYRYTTWTTKEYIIRDKLLPYFVKRKMNEITVKDIITEPKTPKSNKVISMPKFLCDEV